MVTTGHWLTKATCSSRLTGAALAAIKRGWCTTPDRWGLQMRDRLSSSPVHTAGNQHCVPRNLIGTFWVAMWYFADHFHFGGTDIKRKRTPEKKCRSPSPFLSMQLIRCVPVLDFFFFSPATHTFCKYKCWRSQQSSPVLLLSTVFSYCF